VPCSSAEGVARFYTRAGMLLAVLHLLSVTDIHCENIIAAGEHPVIVDLETMLASWPSVYDSGWSMMSTGLLPHWQTAPDGRRFDLSGIGADGTQDAGIGRRAWLHLNTDQMRLSGRQDNRASMTHLPAPTDSSSAGRYLASFVDGFKQMYAHLLRLRPALFAEQSALDMFDGIELRTLIRSTATYTRVQLRLLHPEFIASGLDRSIELEWLAKPLTGPLPHTADREAVYEHELAAMEALDVPYFTTGFAARFPEAEVDKDLDFVRAQRDQALVRARLTEFSADDCDCQVALIRRAVSERYSMVD
jgi:lantibiotic modifying enzyme